MPTNRETFPVEFKGGLVTNQSPLQQGINMPGSATVLRNFEPSISGGYKRILGYSKFDPNVIPPYGAPVVQGANQSGTELIIAGTHTSPTEGDTLTIAGLSGTYTVNSPSFDASNNTTTLTLTTRIVPTAKVNGSISSTDTLVIDDNNGTIAVGQIVTGTGISGTVTVFSITDQNNIVLSSDQSLSDNVVLTFDSSPANGTAVTFVSYTGTYRTLGVEVFNDSVLVALNADLFKTTGAGFTKINVPSYGTVLVNGASQTGTSIVLDGLTSAPKVGDVFKIGASGPTAIVNGATSSTTSLVVDANVGTIVAGQTVTGTGISGTVTVSSLSDQSNLVLSSSQSLANNVALTFSSTTDKIYTVTTSATVSSGGSTVAIDPALASSPADNAAITFISLSREGATRTRFVEYNFTGTPKVAIVDGVNAPALYDGGTFTALVGAPTDVISATQVIAFKKHLFYANLDLLTFCSPSLDTNFEAGDGAGNIRIGGVITGLSVFREQLIIFTGKRIFKLTGTAAGGTDAFKLEPITLDIGCIDGDTIQEIGGDIMFLTEDGLRLLSATDRIGDFGLGVVSKNIQDVMTTFIASAQIFSSAVIRSKSQYRVFAFNPSIIGDAAKGIIGTQFSPQGGEDFAWSEIRGMEVFAASSKVVDTSEVIVFSSDTGYLFKMEDGNSFDSSDIVAEYSSPYMPLNDPRTRKAIYKVYLYTDPVGSVNFTFNLKFDYDELNSVQPESITFTNATSAISFYGDNNYSSFSAAATGAEGSNEIVVSTNTNMLNGSTIVGEGIPDDTTILSNDNYNPSEGIGVPLLGSANVNEPAVTARVNVSGGTSNTTALVVDEAGGGVILAGMTVTGEGIVGNVTVASVVSTNISFVLSSLQTLSDNVLLTFTKIERSTTITVDNKSGSISVGQEVLATGINRRVFITAVTSGNNDITISRPEILADNTAITFKRITINLSNNLTKAITDSTVTSGGSVFGGKVQNIFSTQTVGTGFTTAIQFESISQDPPFTLDTAMLEYATKSRR